MAKRSTSDSPSTTALSIARRCSSLPRYTTGSIRGDSPLPVVAGNRCSAWRSIATPNHASVNFARCCKAVAWNWKKGNAVASKRKRSTVELGHDSFLDIVANLVGILIILVVVLGTQSQQVIEHVRREMESDQRDAAVSVATEDQMTQLAAFSMRAASAQADSQRFERRIKQYDHELEIKSRQRGLLLDLLS